jgi:polyhydroxyalkanoate synthase subunit PhaC
MSTAQPTETATQADTRMLDLAQRLAAHTGRMLSHSLNGKDHPPSWGLGSADPLGLKDAVGKLMSSLASEPVPFIAMQATLATDFARLAQRTGLRMLGLDDAPLIEPEPDDRRFRDPRWQESAYFDALKQAYLLTTHAWLDLIHSAMHLDPMTRQKLEFAVRQISDAMAPTNFVATNPTVLDATLNSGGTNLLAGLDNLLDDLERSQGEWDISTTDHDAFEVGKNLATTPGKVVFQNELLQLIQYSPTTAKVARRPLLVMPPWMNKYYIVDLRPENSLVRWLVEQGQTVFVVSWKNPDASMAARGFEDYMRLGPLAALDAIEQATGEKEVNVAGYCLGGILLAATTAYLQAKGDTRIASATYLTTMVDFEDVGEISLFIDETSLDDLEARINAQGLLDGRSVARTWRALRANDLIWSFYVSSYLLGKSPRPFDILYWNADSTNMPAAMHTFFIRNMYVHNRLSDPGGITLAGVPIDMSKVTTPSYILSTSEDHIAPWRTTYTTTNLVSGPAKFVLAASGHIAGVINPPSQEKYGYWTNPRHHDDADAWLADAVEHKGSWWPDWARWLKKHGGGSVPVRTPGDGALQPIEDAPGTYVRERIDT